MDNGDSDPKANCYSKEVEFYNFYQEDYNSTHPIKNISKAMEMTAEEAVDYVRTKKGALDQLVGSGTQTTLINGVTTWM